MRFRLLTLAAAAALAAGPAAAQDKLPDDLAAVPDDAAAFAHVRAADLWKSDLMKDARALIEKAGADLVKGFDKRFTPAPSGIDRVTVYAGPIADGPPLFCFVVGFADKIDKAKFLKETLPDAKEQKGKNGGWYLDEKLGLGFRFVGESAIAVGPPPAVQELADRPKAAKPGPLAPALALAAAGKRAVVAGVNFTAVPQDEFQRSVERDIPEPLRPLFAVKTLVASLDIAGNGKVYVQADYPDQKSADAAEKAAKAGKEFLTKLVDEQRKELTKAILGDGKPGKLQELPEATLGLLMVGALNRADDYLKQDLVKRDGNSLALSAELPPEFKTLVGPGVAVSAGLLIPAVQKVRAAASRSQSQVNLQQIGVALHNYHDAQGAMPPAAVVDKKGKPQLSWRVLILPYIEQDALYKEFKLDEPWDSDHNKKLIPKMPKVYKLAAANPQDGHTHYRVFVGKGAAWDWLKGATFNDFKDGTSNTWLAVEAQDAVPWTKPDELEYDPKADVKGLGTHSDGGFNALTGDGAVRFIRANTAQKVIHALITKDGGEAVGID